MISTSIDTRLRCEHLSKEFGGIRAIVDVTIDFPTRGLVVVVGPNGSGKTTLLNGLAGYVHPDSGDVFLDERRITGMSPHRRARLGLVRTFQGSRIVKRLPAWMHLLVATNRSGRDLLRRARPDVQMVDGLRRVGLQDAGGTLAGHLSFGQQRLLGVASAFAARPRVLLCDEPTAGLHPDRAGAVISLLMSFAQTNPVVVVEHNPAMIDIADYILELRDGRPRRFERTRQ